MNKVLLGRLQADFPDVVWREGKKYLFRPPKTIMLGPAEEYDDLLLLHELGHYLCGHRNFDTLPRRVKMEREAWDKARELCNKYGVSYNEDVAETELDTYRDWLDAKSRCPKCGLTRYQTSDGEFHCPRCENFT